MDVLRGFCRFAGGMIVGAVLSSGTVRAVDVNTQLVTIIPGTVYDARVVGNKLYMGDFRRLSIYDLTNPTQPALLGQTPEMPAAIVQLSLRNGLAYAANFAEGCSVVSIANPAAPTILDSFDWGGSAVDFSWRGNSVAYIAAREGGLQIADASDPLDLDNEGVIPTVGLTWRLASSGNLLFIADVYLGLQIYDVSNPFSPQMISQLPTGGQPYGLAVRGDLVYVADLFTGLVVVDVSDAYNPTIVKTVLCTSAWDLTLDGCFLYLVRLGAGLSIYNIADPANPVYAGHYDTAAHAWNVSVRAPYIYVSDATGGLVILRANLSGDLTGDGEVDQADLALVLSAYGETDAGDLNGDGVTDQADLAILLANYGSLCTGPYFSSTQ